MSEVEPGGLTLGRRGPGPGRASLVCGAPVAPLLLSFGSLEAPRQNKTSGTCFIQFREYFLVSLLKHKNSRIQGTGIVATCRYVLENA
jgi:hypothetical protein